MSQLISVYQDCCRKQDHHLDDVIASLDGLIKDKLFTELIHDFKNQPARELYPEVFSQ